MPEMTRRRLLGSVASVAGATAAFSVLPPNLRKAIAAGTPRHGSLRDVEHVVLLMQENRSFDHYFGTLSGVRGFQDPDALTLSTGKSVFYQPDPDNPDGYLLPFHLDTSTTSAQALPTTNHNWGPQHSAWNNGAMDNWVPAHRAVDGANAPYIMGYFTRDDLPFHYALADAFTIADRNHCSVLGPTDPNRMYWMTGTIDPSGANGGPMTTNTLPPNGFTWTTYPERLQAAGVDWRVYQEEDNGWLNPLEFFANYHNALPGTPLYDRGLARNPAGQFEQDARDDKLPAVSWLIPPSYQSEHPAYTPAAGADYIASKIEAVAANPDVWRKTAFIITYDENDGLFDHMPPPTPPAGTPDEFVQGVPIGAGFRVPMLIVSPWTVGGWVATEPFDHTSSLQFLEAFTGVEEPNISDWRRETFGDLTSVFQWHRPASRAPRLPATADEVTKAAWQATHLPAPPIPGTDQTAPVQEHGTRRQTPTSPQTPTN